MERAKKTGWFGRYAIKKVLGEQGLKDFLKFESASIELQKPNLAPKYEKAVEKEFMKALKKLNNNPYIEELPSIKIRLNAYEEAYS